jgi:hypothetical protein
MVIVFEHMYGQKAKSVSRKYTQNFDGERYLEGAS